MGFLLKIKCMKFFALIAVLISGFAFSEIDDEIIGVWQIKLPGNVVGTINYRKDSTFVTSLNNKIFTSGKYRYKDRVMTFVEDNGCRRSDGNYMIGEYRINFFATDSIQFDLVHDSCGARRKDLNQLKLGRPAKNNAK
jgi:hypothetical protein